MSKKLFEPSRYWLFVWFNIEKKYGEREWEIVCTKCDFVLNCINTDTPFACPKCGWCEDNLSKKDRRTYELFGAKVISLLLQSLGYDKSQVDWRKEWVDGGIEEIVYGATLWDEQDEEAQNHFYQVAQLCMRAVVNWQKYLRHHNISYSGFQKFKCLDDLPGLESIFAGMGAKAGYNMIPYSIPIQKKKGK